MSRDRLLFLRRPKEIERVKSQGRRWNTSLFSLISCAIPESSPRVCVIVGGRFGKAVVRNRAKRLFRALARQHNRQLVSDRAFVVYPRRRALEVNFVQLREAWVAALRHEGLLVCESGPTYDKSASG